MMGLKWSEIKNPGSELLANEFMVIYLSKT